jgi:hypothetical protein
LAEIDRMQLDVREYCSFLPAETHESAADKLAMRESARSADNQ